MLFIASFRLFCNTVSKEGWDRKQQREIIYFKQPGLHNMGAG